MNDVRPFMLLRARPLEAARAEFDAWFHQVHLKDVARIPGIVSVRRGTQPDGTKLAIYTFASVDAVQPALASPEAAYSRGTWEEWGPKLEELLIEIWSAAFPIPIYREIN